MIDDDFVYQDHDDSSDEEDCVVDFEDYDWKMFTLWKDLKEFDRKEGVCLLANISLDKLYELIDNLRQD